MAQLKRPRDPNQLGKLIADIATGEVVEKPESVKAKAGRAGGLKGGRSRMGGLTDEERVKLAKKAAEKRWNKAAPQKGAAKLRD